MDLELGKTVVSSDGEKVGRVDRLVFDANTKELRQFIVHQGTFLTSDRIVDRPMIDHVDDDGTVHLNAPAAVVEQQPEFVVAEFLIPTEDELRWFPHAWVNSGGGVGAPILYGPGELGQGYDQHGGLFEPAPLNPPQEEVRSNLAEDSVMLDRGTNVVDRDGEKVGTVEDVIYDENGAIAGFVVKAGFLFHHDVRIPADLVESMSPASVRLKVSADEAESAGADR
ncbi:MAG TPA: PRC-barrel domain-containing protein [Thermomicrobiaceae bacterium]|nr:PRC-barrel domain-containing protein [Thermomicrobiaceae bacterium]